MDEKIRKLLDRVDAAVGKGSLKIERRSLVLAEATLKELSAIKKSIESFEVGEKNRLEAYREVSKALADKVKAIALREYPTEVSIRNLPEIISISQKIIPREIKIDPPSWYEKWFQKQNENESILLQIFNTITGIARIVPNMKKYEGVKKEDTLRSVLVDKEGKEYDFKDVLNPLSRMLGQIRGGGGSSQSSGVDPVGLKNVAGVTINPATQETVASIDGKDFATQTTLALVKAKTDNIPSLGQALMASSVPVTIASNQGAIPVSATDLDIRNLTNVDIVTAELSAVDNAVLDSILLALTNASQKSQVVDGAGNVISSTANALDVNIKNTSVRVTSTSGDLADGSLVTLGLKADARSTATDTTAVTIMSVLKQISFMEQAPASRAVTNAGAFAVQASLETGSMYQGTTAKTPVTAFANVAASQTDSSIVAAQGASNKIRVLQIAVLAGGTATTITFNSKPAGAGVAISPLFANGANGGEVLPFSQVGWFDTVANEALTVTTGAGSTTGILVKYIVVT